MPCTYVRVNTKALQKDSDLISNYTQGRPQRAYKTRHLLHSKYKLMAQPHKEECVTHLYGAHKQNIPKTIWIWLHKKVS